MNRRTMLWLGALATATWLAGCGDGYDESTRFNQALGSGTANVPISATVDTSILSDPANYTPATFDPIVPGGGATAPGAKAADANPEVAAIQDLAKRRLNAIFNGEVDAVLDCYPDDKVEALRDSDFPESADELVTNIRDLWKLVTEKSADTDLSTLFKTIPQLLPMVRDLAIAGNKVEMVGENEAMIVPDLDGLRAKAEAMRPQLVPALDKLIAAVPGAPPGQTGEDMFNAALAQAAAGAQMAESMPATAQMDRIVKVGDEWRFDLPIKITADQADAINGAVLAVNDFLDQVHDRVAALDKLDSTSLQGLEQQLMMPAMGLGGQLMTTLQPLMGEMAVGAATSEAAADASEESAAASEPAPSFSKDILPILTDRCVSCHKPGGRAERAGLMLNFEPDSAYAALVNAKSEKDDSLVLVAPNDVKASYLYAKLSEEHPAHGKQMPLNDDPLTPDELELFQRWIEAGAPNDMGDENESNGAGGGGGGG